MIDNDKIIKASDQYVGHGPDIDEDAYASAKREAFIEGVRWFKSALWHDASEEPKPNKSLIINNGGIWVEMFEHSEEASWTQSVGVYSIYKWCYIEDLLSLVHNAKKGGDK